MSRLKRCGLDYLSDKKALQGHLHQIYNQAVNEDLQKRDTMKHDRTRSTLAWDATFKSLSGVK